MEADWALAKRGAGVFVLHADGRVTLLEFNAFLQWIAVGAVQGQDCVLSAVYTNGQRRRAADLCIYRLVRSGVVRTECLPLRSGDGVLATGDCAVDLLHTLEASRGGDEAVLLRPVSHAEPASYCLRPIGPGTPEDRATCLLQPAAPFPDVGAQSDPRLQRREIPAHRAPWNEG